jgi:hypothetical protein
MRLGSKKTTGSFVLDRRDQQALGVIGVGRDHRLHAGDMGEQGLGRLAVGLAAEDAAAVGRADGERQAPFAGGAVAHPRRLRDDLVEGGIDIIGELDLGDRPQPVGGHADRGRDDAVLGDRRVEHAVLAIFLLEALGGAEDAAEIADILAEGDDVRVALHHHVMGAVDRLDHVHDGHLRFASSSATICACCSFRCQGISSKTSSNIVVTLCGKSIEEVTRVPDFSASRWARGPPRRELLLLRGVPFLVPFAEADQMELQPLDRIAERPMLALRLRPVAAGVVARRMALDAIGEHLDQGRAEIGAGPLRGPGGRGIDGERVVAVDPEPGDAVADRARGEGGELAAGDPREARDRPLVVDDVEDHRRAIDAGEGAGRRGNRPRPSSRRRSRRRRSGCRP